MKNLMMAVLFVIGFTAVAQEAPKKTDRMTVEQRTELRVKELTLKLDLDPAQQKEIAKLLADQAKNRKAAAEQRKADRTNKATLTADQRFERRSKLLDERIAMQTRLKKILTPAQLEKFEQLKSERSKNFKHKRKHHDRGNQRKGEFRK